jgi:thiosulfate reductase cytochrome b subunit
LAVETPETIHAATPALTLRLERKHPLAIRWMHWINFPVLFIMILSGLRIYWNDSDNAHLHPHAIYRIGFGSVTLLRIFPEPGWKALNISGHVTEGMGDHFFFMWIFASLLTGLAIYKPTQTHYLTTLLGGYEWARWEHFWLTIGFCLFFLVHITQVAFAGWNSFCSMISGFEVQPVTETSLEAERKSWR